MPHVSKKFLQKEIYNEIYNTFIELLASLKSKKESKSLIDNVLTKTERLMIAKRIAVISMLVDDESYYKIAEKLKISPSTAARLAWDYESNQFSFIVKKLQDRDSVFFNLKKVLSSLPSRGGKRWDFLKKI